MSQLPKNKCTAGIPLLLNDNQYVQSHAAGRYRSARSRSRCELLSDGELDEVSDESRNALKRGARHFFIWVFAGRGVLETNLRPTISTRTLVLDQESTPSSTTDNVLLRTESEMVCGSIFT